MRHQRASVLMLFCSALLAQAESSKIAGSWLAELNLGAIKPKIGFVIKDTAGKLSAEFESLDQGINIPSQQVDFTGANIVIQLRSGKFEGTLSPSGDQLAGTLAITGYSGPVTFNRVAELPR